MLARSVMKCLLHKPFLDFFLWDSCGIFNLLITMDETWIDMYDPETKQQSKEWRQRDSPCLGKFKTQKSSSKVLASVFNGKDGILLDMMQKC
jgi:hypothetical protein